MKTKKKREQTKKLTQPASKPTRPKLNLKMGAPKSQEEIEKLNQEKDMEWMTALKPFRRYALQPNELLQTKFQPISNQRFIFQLQGVDSFLVKRVERPPYIKPSTSWEDRRTKTDKQLLDELTAHKKLVVYLHECISPSARQQVQELLDNLSSPSPFPTEAQIKMLDPIGTVISQITYSGIVVERVDYDPLDYSDKRSIAEIKLTLGYDREKLEF